MRLRHYDYTPEAAGTATIAALQTLGAAGTLALSGTYGASGFPSKLAWTITLTSANNLSGVNFTINYLDAQNNAQSVVVAGPNATTKSTTAIAGTVTSITTSAAAAAVSVGHTNVGYGPWKHLPMRVGYVGSTASLNVSGTATCAIEATYANIARYSVFTGTFDYFTKPVNVAASATLSVYDVDRKEVGMRLRIDAYTSGTIRLDLAVPAAG